MAIECYPTWGESGTLGFGAESYSMKYVVQGTSDRSLAIAALFNATYPAIVGVSSTLYRQPFDIDDQKGGVWHATIAYKPPDSDDDDNDDDRAAPGAFKLSWDTGGGTTKITESKEMVASGGVGLPFALNTIGWDGKKVNGCEIHVPQLTITVDVFYSPSFITNAAVTGWARATGKTNVDSWLGFDPGECLLLGCTGEQTFSMINGRATKPAPVSFKIGCSENIPSPFTIKGSPDLVAQTGKKGWEHLDVFYTEKTFGTAPNQLTTAVAESFRIHRVYEKVSFRSIMGIG
jgi:hypothetical protein